MNTKPRSMTNSMLQVINKCKRKFFLQYMLFGKGIVSVGFHFPFFVGSAVHVGVLTLLATKDLEYALSTAVVEIEDFRAKYEKFKPLSAQEEQEFQFQVTCIEGMIRGYYRFKEKFIKKVILLEHEKIYTYPKFFMGNFILTSKIDALIEYEDDVYVYELKTSKGVSRDYMTIYYPQFIFYSTTVGAHVPVKGVYVDIMKKPGITLKQNEDEVEFMVRLEEYYLSSENFGTEIFEIPERHKEQLFILAKEHIEFINSHESIHDYSLNRYSCTILGRCEYMDLCDFGITPMVTVKFRRKYAVNEELMKEGGKHDKSSHKKIR